ncbi:single-stranded-DNA-specific exonuclease RecJ [Candidatus Daviesbacteria bacterium]|nr:single-stranded-DNA-specific exonuclease RecJ [Candidatus Daviesbacteria bacterium]
MPKVWKVLPKVSDNLEKQLLFNRGLKTKQEIDHFLTPKLIDFSKDLKIPGIPKALTRIKKAIVNNELIIVYGDYDVDGVCASAILYKALTSIGAKVLPYIPHREKEGYGLSKLGLEFSRDSGAGLVITVDNGIVALEQASFAKEIGLDLIITDHHLPLDTKPEALAIVHSTKMCGAAVAWCLVSEVIKRELNEELSQFVAIATISDMMPLLGLNRAFVFEGLKVLNSTKNPGLLELIKEAGLTLGQIGAYEVGHMLSPRLNAIGRLEHAIDALRLLCTKDSLKASKLARLLTDANTKRQILTVSAIEEAKLLLNGNGHKKIHILDSKDWSPGIIGLVAARVCEEYHRPAIAISIGESYSKGSARSVAGVNIVEVIRKCSDILIDIGGHQGAAGFSIANENLEVFKEKLELLAQDLPEEVEQTLEIEAEVESKLLTKGLVAKLNDFEPFGIGNPKPLLSTNNMKVANIKTVGEDGKHLKFRAEGIEAIAFGMGDMVSLLKEGTLVDLAYFLEINRFNGSEILQLKVKDIKLV